MHLLLVSAAIVAMGRRLALQGYRLPFARNGLAAMRLFETHPKKSRLLVVGVIMPVLSGHDAYSQMCVIRPDLVVIFATGYTVELTPESRARGRCGHPAEAIFFADHRSSHSEHAGQRP